MKKLLLGGCLAAALVLALAGCENPADGKKAAGYQEVKSLVLSMEPGQTEGTLLWVPPDAEDFAAVVITSNPPRGSLLEPQIVEKERLDFAINGLEYGESYAITVKAAYLDGGLSAGLTKTTDRILKLTTSLEELEAELEKQSPNSSANPYLIGPTWIGGTDDYGELLESLERAARYVELDLSASPMESVLYPIPFSENGKKYVVGITLPESVTELSDAQKMGVTVRSDGYSLDANDFPGVFNAAVSATGGLYGVPLTKHSHGYYSLKSVNMPGVIEIGEEAFWNCSALESVSAPVAEIIGNSAFDNCVSLKEISLPSAKYIGKITNFVTKETFYACGFQRCEKLETVDLPKVEILGIAAFSACVSLKSISLPEAVDIGRQAFSDCTALADVDLPKARTIGSYAFSDCRALRTITLPKAESIDGFTFGECDSLESVSLPSLTEFKYTSGRYQFSGAYSLKSVTLGETIPAAGLGAYSFFEAGRDSGGFTIYVPTEEAKSTLEGYLNDGVSDWWLAIYAEENFTLPGWPDHMKFSKAPANFKGVEVRAGE